MACEDRHGIDALNYPTSWNTTVRADRGIYVQDTWTLDRLTINAGVRYDHFESLINTFRTGGILPGGRFISERAARKSRRRRTGTISLRGSAPRTTCSATRGRR